MKQKVKTSTCIEDSTNWDQYCLEKSIAAQLCCKVPEVPHWKTGTYDVIRICIKILHTTEIFGTSDLLI